MIRIGLIQFPGSNCERETALAVKRAGMEPVEFLWNEPLEKLRSLDGYIIVGGFSYEDRSRAGIIAALDPVIQEIKAQSEKRKPILGICNGAQILVESGLVPGLENHHQSIALTENKRILDGKIVGTGFYNSWVHMRLSTNHQHNAFTHYLTPADFIYLPIAHAEGRFLMDESLLDTIEKQGLNLFQYCDAEGNIINNFPINPNGSAGNIAAVSNQQGNILAMMPHPERTPNGDAIFTSMRDYIADNRNQTGYTIHQSKNPIKPQHFDKIPGSHLCLVKLIITDNQALTVQKTLRRLGFPVTVNRFEHWEIDCDSAEGLKILNQSELLYSPRKEHEVPATEFCTNNAVSILVRPKEDLKGQQTLQTLKTHYLVQQVKQIKHGVVWQFKSEDADLTRLIDAILLTSIIGNPYAHEHYIYQSKL
ncbi:phosphoribosylformylglycinamidine synthase I [Legionella micdadei]|uniref:Phosphoribosylformylglycinamidine synthase I n=1 Tax=Legionella micdadei TaxID=451 RepID=A0A098GBU2_LEGMI|nr:phosphoribosylformylglycinamidine synthase I [Legionella micdadei]ARG98367.1 phosphoribosylformylglycinamidine synthase I [Legionella micdadei]KTD27300.1 phosphoribosylformylglycinamidine synthase I (FGAM synthase I) [Legionella micdadei]NSL18684.1 phosphoribosylformylglycinamidine synthase I [Legionella micdadei]CEG59959.1 Phosphoribosylformylglycinamidine synthase I [Legionella micdadei]SCY60274.1 phosphoribosylformylglycinamidine synthase subunit I [Legionella micdadei]